MLASPRECTQQQQSGVARGTRKSEIKTVIRLLISRFTCVCTTLQVIQIIHSLHMTVKSCTVHVCVRDCAFACVGAIVAHRQSHAFELVSFRNTTHAHIPHLTVIISYLPSTQPRIAHVCVCVCIFVHQKRKAYKITQNKSPKQDKDLMYFYYSCNCRVSARALVIVVFALHYLDKKYIKYLLKPKAVVIR